MWNWFHGLGADNQVKLLALVGAFVAFIIGLFQYRKAQRWKRSEWIAQEMKDFFADPLVKTALQLLDWGSRSVELFRDREKGEERFVIVTDDDLARALAFHSDRPTGFTESEAALRDLFDHFLDRIERINSFVEAGLVSVEDIRPYLDYWAGNVVSARVGDARVKRLVQLRQYIRHYGFSGVEALFARLSRCSFPEDTKANDGVPAPLPSLPSH